MARYTPTTVTSGHNGVDLINTNFTDIKTAIDSMLDRAGASPNTMTADLDLNGNDILNAGTITFTGLSLSTALDVNGKEITGTTIDLHSSGDIILELGDTVGVNKVSIRDSGGNELASINSDGDIAGTDITAATVTTTGNITVGGTVDGRNVAVDGTKLDGIEDNADVTDETNVTAALDGATLTAITIAATDKVLLQDTDDSDNLKTATAQSIADLANTLTQEQVEDFCGAVVATGGTKTGITITYQDGTNDMDFVVDDLTVAGDSGSTGMTPGDTLTIAGGANITTAMSGDTLTITGTAGGDTVIQVDGSAVSTGTPTLDFDGTDFTLTESPTDDFDITIKEERIQDIAGAMFTGNTETGITVTYQDADGTVDLTVSDTTVAGDSGSTGITPGDTLTIAGGTNATTAMSGDTLTINVDDAFLSNTGDVGTGVYDFGGATSLEIPNGATPTVNAAGEIAVDTTITDHTGLIKYHDGTEELTVIALPTGNLTTTDGHVVSYNATNNEFEMAAAGGGLSNVVEDTTPQLGGALDVNGKEITGAIDLHSTGNIIAELGDAGGTNKFSVRDSGGVEVAAVDSDGNITTSGNVDGRDIATDGTKLDGIENNATADQTDEEIQDIAGPLVATGGTKTGITVTYQDATGDMDFVVSDTTVAGDSGSTGITPGDTLTIAGGTEITTSMSGDTLTINSDFTPSSTDTLTNKTFDANGTGNSLSNVDVADLANGTDGELITWDASGAPTTVAVGTSGHVLTSNGAGAAPTFQAASGGDLDWELVATASASSSATVEFSGLSSTYAAYKVVYTDLTPASDAVNVMMRTGTGGGPTYDSGATDYVWSYYSSWQGGSFNTVDASDSEIHISDTVGTGTSEVANGEVVIYDPSQSSKYHMVYTTSRMINSAGNHFATMGGGTRVSTTAVTGVQFFVSSGNISTGEFRLYGLRNA